MIQHQATFRLVGVVDASAVVQELSESALEDVVAFVEAVVAAHGPEAQVEIIEALNRLMWVEEEEEEEDEIDLDAD